MAISWTLNNGVLVISGTGTMNNYASNGAPWYENRSSITSIIIENGVTSIGTHAFYNCTSLTNVTIPDSVTSIGNYAFANCTALTDIYYTSSETEWNAITIGTSDNSLTNATIHYNYSPIVASGYCGGEGDGTNLSWMLDDNGVLTISGTGAMEDFTVNTTPWYENKNSITSIIIENGLTNIGDYAFSYCKTLTNATIPNSVTSIDSHAFSNCNKLTSVTIPDSVTSIGSDAFSSCSALTNIIIPDSVTDIDNYAFFSCTSLTNIIIPNNVINIGNYTFYGCRALSSVTIPDGVTNIGDSAFYNCTTLTDVYYTSSETDWNAITIGTNNDPLLNATKHYGSSSTNLTYLVTKAELTSIANAIRAKAGTTSKYTWPN